MCRNLYTSGYYEFMHISSINDKLAVMGFRIVFYGSFIIETLLVDKKKKKTWYKRYCLQLVVAIKTNVNGNLHRFYFHLIIYS